MRLLILFSFFALIFAAHAAPIAAQDAVDITIFRDEDSLTLYIPAEGQVSLQGLTLQGGDQNYLLQAYTDFQFINFSRIHAPACLRLERDGTRRALPQECSGAEITKQALPDANVFWFDNDMNQEQVVFAIDNTPEKSTCPQVSRCDLSFVPFPEPPEGMDVEADVANHEVLVLIAQFEQLSGNPIEPHREWEFVLNRAIADLGDTVNARVLYVPRYILDHDDARALSEQYQATLVIWGMVRAAALESNYTVTPRWSRVVTQPGETEIIGTIDELSLFVSPGGDTEYILSFVLGQLNYWSENREAAIHFFERAIVLAPVTREREMGTAAIYFYLGNIQQIVQEDFIAALSSYAVALEIEPTSKFTADIYNNRGTIYYKQEKYDLAIADYNQAIALNPYTAEIYYNRGNAYDEQENYNLAIADFDQAIYLKPNFTEAYNNRGNSYEDQEEYALAITDYNQAIALDPNFAPAYIGRGNILSVRKLYRAAISEYSQAIALDPNLTAAYIGRGVTYTSIAEYDLAIINLNHAIGLEPDYAEAYYNRGFAYHNQGRYGLAIADFTQAISYKPDFDIAYSQRGIIYIILEDYSQALNDFTKALELNPENMSSYAGIGILFDMTGQTTNALASFRRYLELAGDNAAQFVIDRVGELEAATPTPSP